MCMAEEQSAIGVPVLSSLPTVCHHRTYQIAVDILHWWFFPLYYSCCSLRNSDKRNIINHQIEGGDGGGEEKCAGVRDHFGLYFWVSLSRRAAELLVVLAG